MTDTTIELRSPIRIDGAEVTALRLRRPKVRDMLRAEKASGSDAEREIRLFADLCEVEPAAIEELDLADYQALQRVYQGFLS